MNRRVMALVAAAAAIFPFVVAAPGYASKASDCRTLLAGPTPSVEVDTNNDGNPELRVPSLTNARLCVFGDVRLDDAPSAWNEPCSSQGTCHRFFLHYGLSGDGSASAQLCFSLDGLPSCAETVRVPVPLDVVRGGTMCIGVDAQGGSPCGGGTSVISFS